jgi:tryptophan synthase beta chain
MTAYMSYNDGSMGDTIPTDADLERGFATLPDIPQKRKQ